MLQSCNPSLCPVRWGGASHDGALPHGWEGAGWEQQRHRHGGDGKNPFPSSKSETILKAVSYYPSALVREYFQNTMHEIFPPPSPEQSPALRPLGSALGLFKITCTKPRVQTQAQPEEHSNAQKPPKMQQGADGPSSTQGLPGAVGNPATSRDHLGTRSGGFSASHQGCGCSSAP